MNNNNNGLLVILSGPSGSGKDTILTELTKRDMNIKVSTSMTTRKKREWEVDGIHYYFVDKDYFMRKIDEGQVLEYAQYGINYYGTPKAPVDELLAQGRTVFLKIEVQGAEKIRKLYPRSRQHIPHAPVNGSPRRETSLPRERGRGRYPAPPYHRS